MYLQAEGEESAPDFKTAIAYTELYSKLMGVDSGYLINRVNVNFTAGDKPDHACVEFDLTHRKHFLYYKNFGYMVNPGQLEFGYQLLQYHPRLQRMDLLERTIFGRVKRYPKEQNLKFVRQEFQPWSEQWLSIVPVFQYSYGSRKLEANASEQIDKTSIQF